MKQINLHSHDEYSNIVGVKDSTNRLPKMVDYVANTLGQKGFAMTNHEYIGNHLKLEKTVDKLKSQGKIPQDFKPIYGNEIYLLGEEELKTKLENKDRIRFYHFILLAKNLEGHKQIRELSARAWKRMFSYRGLDRRPTYYEDLEDIVGSNPGNVIGLTACIGGFLGQSILNEKYDQAHEFIHWCQDVFGEDNFFLEMQPHIAKFDEEGNEIITEQQVVNEWIYKQDLPTVITTDAHYLHKGERELHKAYLKSDEDDEVYASGGRETDDFYGTTYFMSEEEIIDYLHYLPLDFIHGCFANSTSIWESCDNYTLKSNTIIPRTPLPNEEEWYFNDELLDFIYDNEQHFTYILDMWEHEEPYNAYLISLMMYGMLEDRKIPRERWFEVLSRVNTEMYELMGISEVKNVTMSCYFTSLYDLLDVIWNNAECMVGVSRGSAVGWELNYLLQIAHEDPLKQPVEMPHWRFLSSERPDFPKYIGVGW